MNTNRRPSTVSFSALIASAALAVSIALPTGNAGAAGDDEYDPALFQPLQWRNVGPFRGGRATAVAGVPSQPLTFFMGATGGGVWQTVDGGLNWDNVSDGWFKTGSVGAIAVALSDPNVIYVGMGEHCVRGVTTSHGDGVYKSTDGGKTWIHLGLEATRHISQIRIHPENPDVVYVGAQGSPWGPHPERGVYRSQDGGKSWELVPTVNEHTGANDLSMDARNPRILYAAMWQHRRKPWHGYQLSSGGPGSGLYRSTDGGDTWQKLSTSLPAPAGKFAVSVSPAESNRVYALVEAKPSESGVYRSDDGGESWQQVNDLHVMTERSAYYMHVFADPQDAQTVYVLNAPMFKSTDGGKTYERVATPHGDNHDLWIHPDNNQWMVEANDGGANVSYDGAKAWSTQGNQPTAQFYRVITDNQFPFHLYAGQQDNSTVKIPSRTFSAGIGPTDWSAVGGGESAHVAFDPDDPVLVYAGSYQGQITEFDTRTGLARNVMHYPMRTAFRRDGGYRYRFNWNAPIVVSTHDPSVIYHGSHMLLKSTDRGQSWQAISPDLTRNERAKQGLVEGEFTFEGTGGEMYNTIFYIAESPDEQGTIWVGTDDGYVQLTRDEGQSWTDVTPRNLGETQINMIELSPHDPATAYVVATAYKLNDFSPHIYKTDDYGKSWREIVRGIPEDAFVRVVREDPVRQGLLYAGSETGMFVSLNDGADWQSLQLNLPVVPVTDLRVHGNDLVAATQGRAFWILDDVSPLRQTSVEHAASEWHLFSPSSTQRVQITRSFAAPGRGQNPPTGTLIYYSFAEQPDLEETPVKLDILDEAGQVIRSYSTEPPKEREERLIAWFSNDAPPVTVTTNQGLNRLAWDWYRSDIEEFDELSAYRGPRSYRVAPGRYSARLTVGDDSAMQTFEVLPDPRWATDAAAYAGQQALLGDIFQETVQLLRRVSQVQELRADVEQIVGLLDEQADAAETVTAGRALIDALDSWEDSVVQSSDENFIDPLHSPDRLDFNMLSILSMVDGMEPPISGGLAQRVAELRAQSREREGAIDAIVAKDVAAFNALTSVQRLPPVGL